MAAISAAARSFSLDEYQEPAPAPNARRPLEGICRELAGINGRLTKIHAQLNSFNKDDLIRLLNAELTWDLFSKASGTIPGYHFPPDASIGEIALAVSEKWEQLENDVEAYENSNPSGVRFFRMFIEDPEPLTQDEIEVQFPGLIHYWKSLRQKTFLQQSPEIRAIMDVFKLQTVYLEMKKMAEIMISPASFYRVHGREASVFAADPIEQ